MGTTNHEELATYIENYWVHLRQENTLESKTALGLPHPYYVPSVEVVDGFSFPHMFYWDTYFTAQGFWGTPLRTETVGLAENMFDLIRRLGFVPNSNSFSHLSRSQPPLLSTFVRQIHERIKPNDFDWLHLAYVRIREEYKTVWLGTEQPHNRQVYEGLSRYYDTNVIDVLAEAESGWDYTTRFENQALRWLPVDLNAMLYKYEVDLAWIAEKLGRQKSVEYWNAKSNGRRATMNRLMWSHSDLFFYDYQWKDGRKGGVKSLAAYVPMFAGMCTDEQAAQLVEHLVDFETDHGLTTTAKKYVPIDNVQWAVPNGWAPLHDLVVDGLLTYGYEDEAKRIAEKWVTTVHSKFQETGKIFEKYNMMDPLAEAGNAVYPDQHGFGWTNGVTYKFIQLLK